MRTSIKMERGKSFWREIGHDASHAEAVTKPLVMHGGERKKKEEGFVKQNKTVK